MAMRHDVMISIHGTCAPAVVTAKPPEQEKLGTGIHKGVEQGLSATICRYGTEI